MNINNNNDLVHYVVNINKCGKKMPNNIYSTQKMF